MKICIITPYQFGYMAGYFHYCKHLEQKGHSIDFFCNDDNLPKIDLPGVSVHYHNKASGLLNWRFYFLRFIRNINFSQYDIILINQQKFCFLYRLAGVPRRSMLDIRSGDISYNQLKRIVFNLLITLDTLFYDHITVPSEELIGTLNIRRAKCSVIPLGSDIFSSLSKNFEEMNLLYIGTFNQRNIHQTVRGVALFKKAFADVPVKYDIIGFGSRIDEMKIKEEIDKYQMNDIIVFHGRKNYTELNAYLEKANIGLSYIPMTKFFDVQPPTKTFEYILSGLVCIATRTAENEKLIREENGVLCDDNPESLCQALIQFYRNRKQYNSDRIRESLMTYTWSNIIETRLEPLLLSLA